MKLFLAIFVVLAVNVLLSEAFFPLLEDNIYVKEAVKFYNSIPGLTWTAGTNGLGRIIKLSQIKSKLGWKPRRKTKTAKYGGSPVHPHGDDGLPMNYDCRTAFPQCTTISSIKTQANCGSCWAVATAAAFSDRICIHSNGSNNYNMSANQLLACDKESHGCEGGYLDTAWKYIADHGLVTGGDYGSNEGCQPYSIPSKQSFFAASSKTPECRETSCPVSFKASNKTFTQEYSDEYLIRKEIYKNGPLTTGFMTFLSLQFYKHGIYSRLFIDLPMGGHAVRVIGWGVENNEKYWLVANSWGRKWGENGTFRIRRGTDECGFESNMIAALPQFQH